MAIVRTRRDAWRAFAAVAGVAAVCGSYNGGPASAQSSRSDAPTFSRDIAPILQRSCERCHRPGSIGPMSLVTYQDVRPWARSIKARVASREMPPWHVDRTVGIQKFQNDPSLSDAEIQAIVKWADAGAPQGNPADMPPPIVWAAEDQFSFKPDLIVHLKKDIMLPAFGSDQWMNVEMEDTGLTEDRYIQQIEIKPLKGAKVVHHANAIARREAVKPGETGPSEGSSAHLVEYAVGKAGESYPADSGKLLPAGSKLTMNLHLHSYGEETAVNTALGFKFHPKGYVPKRVQYSRVMPNAVAEEQEAIDIPPGVPNARTDSFNHVTRPMRITAFQPHMHSRGKRQCLEAIYPPAQASDASRSPGGGPTFASTAMLNCVDFQFNWHLQYTYAEDAQPLLPAGTVLHLISWHDNSANSKSNPDPTAWIGWGQRSTDEMALAWMEFSYLTEDEYKAAIAERRAKRTAATQGQP